MQRLARYSWRPSHYHLDTTGWHPASCAPRRFQCCQLCRVWIDSDGHGSQRPPLHNKPGSSSGGSGNGANSSSSKRLSASEKQQQMAASAAFLAAAGGSSPGIVGRSSNGNSNGIGSSQSASFKLKSFVAPSPRTMGEMEASVTVNFSVCHWLCRLRQ